MTTAEKFRKWADGLQPTIDHKRSPLTANPTPRRLFHRAIALHDAANLERAQKALRALADLHEQVECPDILASIRYKKNVLELTRTIGDGSGYYSYVDTGQFACDSDRAMALQALITETPAERRAREKEALEIESKRLIGTIPGFFQTPASIARRMVQWADIRDGMTVIEPSAGAGAIADVITEMHPGVDLVVAEDNYTLSRLLKRKGYVLVAHDFFAHRGQYDRIIQNPPFEKQADIDHVYHAWECLKPGGVLVSVMAESVFFRGNSTSVQFREFLDEHGYDIELSRGAFQESGTGVKARIVVLRK